MEEKHQNDTHKEKKPRIRRPLSDIIVLKFVRKNSPIHMYLPIARLNPYASDFPDFIFDGGFIEHFK